MTIYADQTVRNRSLLKRFSHLQRFKRALQLLALKADDSVLDFGTGDGFMLGQMLQQTHVPRRIVGYEPVAAQFCHLNEMAATYMTERVSITMDMTELKGQVFNKICCLEVLEHLTADNQRRALRHMYDALAVDGVLVVSVPIEIGPSGFAKNLARLLLRQRHGNSGPINMAKALLGLRIERREQAGYINSHLGFDYRDLEKQFALEHFSITRARYSPFHVIGVLCNSQILYRLQKRTRVDREACSS